MASGFPAPLDDRYRLTDRIPPEERPVVFVGPYEHHSNELPWRESIADVVEIFEDADGHIDLGHLEEMLEKFSERPLRIGSFSAASNVTGIISDTSAISSLLHEHGALSFWDFAAAAPYVGIEMRSPSEGPDYKDAIFLSPHKFIGGPGTPGVLVARKSLLINRVPSVPGGGTVTYVNTNTHHYSIDAEHREEGGTPAIIESIRAGLVFQLKEAVGVPVIREKEETFIRNAIDSWSQNPNIRILGNPWADRLSIVSFVVRFGDRYLHHNYVVALLNDLFGIQARGGCSCAGPYGHRLLGITDETSSLIETQIERGCEVIKPGWVRVNFNYFIDDNEFQYILEAVHLIANTAGGCSPTIASTPRPRFGGIAAASPSCRCRCTRSTTPLVAHLISMPRGRRHRRPTMPPTSPRHTNYSRLRAQASRPQSRFSKPMRKNSGGSRCPKKSWIRCQGSEIRFRPDP